MSASNQLTKTRHQDATLLAELAELSELDLMALRQRWLLAFRKPAPTSLRCGMLARAVAYRLQAELHGDVKLGRTHLRQSKVPDAKEGSASVTLLRSWKGQVHEVTCAGNKFEYRGRHWRSLSAIAREITGTRWNGLTFFGVKGRSELSRAVRNG